MESRDQDESESDARCKLELTQSERELLLRACQRYRAAIPTYLKSTEAERALLDRLVERLS